MSLNLGAIDGEEVQERFAGRWCDKCRSLGLEVKALATHARDSDGGGRDFYCDEHLPESA